MDVPCKEKSAEYLSTPPKNAYGTVDTMRGHTREGEA